MHASRSERLRGAIKHLHAAKTADYGTAWKKRGEVLSVLANEARKVDRIEELAGRDVATKNESLLDTYIDLLVYLVKHETLLADESPAIALRLGLTNRHGPVFSETLSAFDALLDSVDLSAIHGDRVGDWRADRIGVAFAALEAHFKGVTTLSSAESRLMAVQNLVTETVTGLAAVVASNSAAIDVFVSEHGGS